MNILIVSATFLEIEPLVKNLGEGQPILKNLTRFKLKKLVVDVLVTGVGMVATAYWTGKALSMNQYGAAINVGICGSFNREFPLGEVVNVISEMLPETGAEDGEYFLSLVDMKLLELDDFPFKDGRLINDSVFSSDSLSKLVTVSGVTVNTVHGNNKSIAKFRERFEADVETMEGAAFFFACLQEDIRYLQLRAISNYVGPRDTTKWNIALAIQKINNVLLNILQE
jgi:futalosine hydrolase